MFRAFLDGLAMMVGFRAGEAAIREVQREVRRTTRERRAKAKGELLDELAAAARQLPGGTAASAFVVASSSQIEPMAGRLECLACDDGRLEMKHHRAETVDGVAVRALDFECRACGSPRTAYFRIDRPS